MTEEQVAEVHRHLEAVLGPGYQTVDELEAALAEARKAARQYESISQFLAVQIRRDTGQPMIYTEAEMQRLRRLYPWLAETEEGP